MKTQDIKNIASAYKQVLEKKTLDPVNPDELKGTHAQRKDKDIDNDGKVDSTDRYLHARRKAVHQAMQKEAKDYGPGHIGAVQKMLDKERDAKKAKDAMKKNESVELDEAKKVLIRFKDQLKSKAGAEDDAKFWMKKAGGSSYEVYKATNGLWAYKIFEEVEQIDEASKENLDKAMAIINARVTKPGQKPRHPSYHSAPDDIKTAAMKLAKNMKEEVEIDEAMTKAQTRALQSVKAQPKDKVSLKPAPWDKKKDEKMNESRWPILQRIMERQNMGNMDNGSPRGEGLSPSAKTELARSEGDSGIDGVKAAADTARNAVAQVKVAPKRRGDLTIGDKTMPKNDGK